MKAFSGVLMVTGMVMQSILGYQFVAAVLPEWMTFWVISTTLTYIGFVGATIAEAQKD
jgi:hypothetical protein